MTVPRERVRTFGHPASEVWDVAQRVMSRTGGSAELVDREGKLLRFHLDGAEVTLFVEALSGGRSRVFVSRGRGAHAWISETAILNEIEAALSRTGLRNE